MKHSYEELKKLIVPATEDKKLEPGSIITIPYDGEEKEFVVLGININPNPNEVIHYDFIDIMSKELLIPVGTQWQKEINNDNLSDPHFNFLNFAKSDIIYELNSKLDKFPEEIQVAAVSKKERFLIGANIHSNDRIYIVENIGKVWLPSIKEITGQCWRSDSDHEAKQYPYFEDIKNKCLSDSWWTCSAITLSGYAAYCIGSDGDYCCGYATSTGCGAPLCLRLIIN